MGKSKYNPEHLDKLALYEKLVDQFPDVDRKGAKNPYTSVNGHMFSFLDQKGLLSIRLSEAERNQFIDTFNTELSVQYGTVMKEYVVVPAHLLEDTVTLAPYFEQSYAYVSGLKPKPTKKKK